MGKTPEKSRLTIWIHDAWVGGDGFKELESKGHYIWNLEAVAQTGARYDNRVWTPDLILHPAAHMWTDEMFSVKGLLDVAMKAARKRKRDGADASN